MKIITISREFGSGGRELAKKLADFLGYDYYDKEIITQIAKNKHLDSNYVEHVLENGTNKAFSITFRNTFSMVSSFSTKTSLMLEEKRVLEEIGKLGRDCVIVGRNADIILQEYQPFHIFVYADMQEKIARCIAKAPQGENLSEKEVRQKIVKVDKMRKETRMIVTNHEWGSKEAYDLMINTSGWEIKRLVPAVAAFAKEYFEGRA